MKNSLVLTLMLSLVAVKLCRAYCEGTQEQQAVRGTQTQMSSDLHKLPALLRRLCDGRRASYEALLRLLDKDDARPKVPVPAQKRDMQDFFVGLMGKRTSEPGIEKKELTASLPLTLDDPTEGNKETFAGAGDPRHSPNAQ